MENTWPYRYVATTGGTRWAALKMHDLRNALKISKRERYYQKIREKGFKRV
jgi:hypothetical protein